MKIYNTSYEQEHSEVMEEKTVTEITPVNSLLQEYQEYLQRQPLNDITKYQYLKRLETLITDNNIQSKEELIILLQKYPKDHKLRRVYKWLQITPPQTMPAGHWSIYDKSIENIIKEYKKYLKQKKLKPLTIKNYSSMLRSFLGKEDIRDKNTLKKKLEENPTFKSGAVYDWLGLNRPVIKRKKVYPDTGYSPRNDPFFQRFTKERNLQKSSQGGFMSSLKHYIPRYGFKNMEEMIEEAREDERNRIPAKEARIHEHLTDYLIFLRQASFLHTDSAINTYYQKIETVYRHYDITIPPRPPLKNKQEYHVDYYDLPSIDMIQIAIAQSNPAMASLIYFMSSSGSAMAETLSITVGMFIEGLRDYTDKTSPRDVLKELQGRRDVVPLIKLTRLKTNVPYHTCCSSEATYYIINYLVDEKRYNADDPLWDMTRSYVGTYFQKLNDKNNWGRVGRYRRFRSHMLRKFHASNLGASFDLINTLEGRSNGEIYTTYVKLDPHAVKEKYLEYMVNVMIHPELFWYPGKPENEVKEYDKHYTITDGNRHDPLPTDSTGDGHGDMQTTTGSLMKELLERLAVLEYRVKQLEDERRGVDK